MTLGQIGALATSYLSAADLWICENTLVAVLTGIAATIAGIWMTTKDVCSSCGGLETVEKEIDVAETGAQIVLSVAQYLCSGQPPFPSLARRRYCVACGAPWFSSQTKRPLVVRALGLLLCVLPLLVVGYYLVLGLAAFGPYLFRWGGIVEWVVSTAANVILVSVLVAIVFVIRGFWRRAFRR